MVLILFLNEVVDITSFKPQLPDPSSGNFFLPNPSLGLMNLSIFMTAAQCCKAVLMSSAFAKNAARGLLSNGHSAINKMEVCY